MGACIGYLRGRRAAVKDIETKEAINKPVQLKDDPEVKTKREEFARRLDFISGAGKKLRNFRRE